MTQARKPGRPREWVLNEEIVEVHRLAAQLKTENPQMHWSQIESMLKKQLGLRKRKEPLSEVRQNNWFNETGYSNTSTLHLWALGLLLHLQQS
jgi:hypothetical protein